LPQLFPPCLRGPHVSVLAMTPLVRLRSSLMRWQYLFLMAFLTAPFTRGEEVKIIPQAEWSKEGTKPLPEKMIPHSDGITSVVIHHTQSPNEVAAFQKARLVNVQRYHIVERGWGDIAYHYLIGSNGFVFEGRNADFQGDSGTSYDLNGRLLICLLGDFTSQLPADEALGALIEMVASSLHDNGLTMDHLLTHRMVAATDCPGDRLQEWFETEGRPLIGQRFGEIVAQN